MTCVSRPFVRSAPLIAVAVLAGCNGTLPLRSDPTLSATSSEDQTVQAQQDTTVRITSVDSVPAAADSSPEQEVANEKPGDIWARIRQGYQLNPHLEAPRVRRQLAWYNDHPEHLKRVEGHARPYLHHIVEELEKRGMPLELALLPVVESAYRPFAYSPGRAAGLWQFIPSTGKMYGLKQNWWYDGRRDVLASTDAALEYLQYLQEKFDGDWELALAGYNAGSGAVRKAIRKNIRSGRPTDYWSLDLPRETEHYVPRLLALAAIVKTPDAYQVSLRPIPDEPYFESVDIEAQLDLTLAAEMADMDLEELYRLNPGFNRWATDPQGPHRILLPLEQIDAFNTRLSELDPDERTRWTRYLIQRGDTLSAIARKHNITVAVLKQSNNLRGDRIRSGSALLIPQTRTPGDLSTAGLRYAGLQGNQGAPRGNRITHTVRRGDSLWEIARSYNVSHKALASWNGLSLGDILRPGQKLVIWTTKPALVTSAPHPDKNPARSNPGPPDFLEAVRTDSETVPAAG